RVKKRKVQDRFRKSGRRILEGSHSYRNLEKAEGEIMSASAKKDLVTQLEDVLQEQLGLYIKYTDHLKADRELMTKLNVGELEHNNKVKSTLLLKLQAMDQARQNLVRQVSKELGIPEGKVKLDDICSKLGSAKSLKL